MMSQIRFTKVEMFTLPKKSLVSLNIGCDILALQRIQVELTSNLKYVYFYIHYTIFKEVWHPHECIFISLRWKKIVFLGNVTSSA